ncbi:MAG: nuclear transport factor 2 family protein [Flavisolibacter sp.]
MKRLTFSLLLCGFAMLSAQAQAPARQVKADEGAMPYEAKMNTNFSIGSAQFSRLVLNLWKDWDRNTLDNSMPLIADDVSAEFADGSTVQGKAAFVKSAKEFRSQFSKVESEVISYASLKGEGEDHSNIVLIWGNETSTKKDGSKLTNQLHEVWVFNDQGQVVWMKQFMSQPPKDE